MLSLTENLSKLESIKISGFTDNSNFVERDYAFISFSKNPKEALKYSKDAIDKGAKIVISQVNLHEHLKDKNLLFLISINILPIFLMLLTSMITGSKIRTMWMTPFYLFFGTLIIYVFQKEISKGNFKKFFVYCKLLSISI